MMKKFTLVVSFLAFISGCEEGEPIPPERPASVPLTATWQGGLDGGDWIDCRFNGALLTCDVYAQRVGNLSSTQTFELCASENPSDWINYPVGEGHKDVQTYKGLKWSPTAPALIYDAEGEFDIELMRKYDRIFSEEYVRDCTPLPLISATP